jgi:hypothetical protein
LLVGPAGTGKSRQLREVAETYATRVINLNLALSGELLELTHRQRVLRIPGILEALARVGANSGDGNATAPSVPIIFDNLEILFDTTLRQDPMRLLQAISRHRPVIAAWSGALQGLRLTYADVGHPESRAYDDPDALLITMSAASKREE